MNDIFKMAEQAYHALSIAESELKRLYKENAELKNSLVKAVEQERENNMLRARNERQEKEIKWLETLISNLQIEVLNLKNAVKTDVNFKPTERN